MVSTRRGARTGPDNIVQEPDSNETLQKKPVRRTTAKTKALPARTRAGARPQRTEDTPVEKTPEKLPNDEIEPSKQTRRTATRLKKIDSSAEEPGKKVTATKPALKTTRAVASKTKLPDILDNEPEEKKPAPQTRATKATRATAAKAKPQALSPKKITQVSKVPARSTKPVKGKPVPPKDLPPANSTRTQKAGRGRAVSDENAELPDLRPIVKEDGDEEIVVSRSNTGQRLRQKQEPQPTKQSNFEADGDETMSTRPTTPADSPKIDSSLTEEDINGSHRTYLESEVSEDELGNSSASEDELCGPKTPMKRRSPRESVKYLTSARKTAEQPQMASQLKTPMHRFDVFGPQRKTPQTQVPYCRQSVPVSVTEPMTVARAQNRAMVFPKLELFPDSTKSGRPAIEHDRNGASIDESIAPATKSEAMEAGIENGDEDHSIQDLEISDDEDDPTEEPPNGNSEAGDHDFEDDALLHNALNITNTPEHPMASPHDFNSRANTTEIFENGFSWALKDAESYENDPEETIVIDPGQMDDDSEFNSSVIHISSDDTTDDCDSQVDNSIDDSGLHASTPKPETLVWENIRQDVTIPLKLDSDLGAAHELPLVEPTEQLSLAASFASAMQGELHAMKQTAEETKMTLEDVQMDEASRSPGKLPQRLSMLSVRQSLDATIHLSEFIEVDSLPETTSATYIEEVGHVDDDEDVNEIDEKKVESPRTPGNKNLVMMEEYQTPTRNVEPPLETNTPGYAIPTIASASKRRKSLPTVSYRTPIKPGSRPITSDGASIARLPNPFVGPLRLDSIPPLRAGIIPSSPIQHRPKTPTTLASTRMEVSSGKTAKWFTPKRQTPAREAGSRARTAGKERRTGSTQDVVDQSLTQDTAAETTTAPIGTTPQLMTNERYPGLPARDTYEELAETPVAKTAHSSIVSTPHTAPRERYPGLPSRRTYEEHAKTAIVPTRFRTPTQIPAKRPATTTKPGSLRKLALRASTPSKAPIKTPSKAPANTPGLPTMTPHPGAPLRGVLAVVEVYTNDGSLASSPFVALLQRLGAKTTKSWSNRITHVVFKGGAPNTLHRVRVHNNEVIASGTGTEVFCVNSRWVTDCDAESKRVDESDEAYSVDFDDATRSSKRRRKSMEPAALVNLGGNVARNRKSSLGRASFGRLSMKFGSPAELPQLTPEVDVCEKENSGDNLSSPITPAYLAAPSTLVQQTAPMKRIRKLDLQANEQAKSRRLTFWNGGA